MTRTMFEWDCTIQSDTGEVKQRKLKAFWSPEKTESASVALAAAAMETKASGKKHVPISAQLVAN
jgi:hypothetical protein